MRLLTTTFFALLVIAFAGTSITQSEEARNPLAEDVFQRFLSAFTNSDVEGIVNLFSEDAIFWGTGSAELVEDTAGIRLYFSGLSNRPPGEALARAQNFSIMELSSDSVLISGMWEVVPQGQDTGTPLRISMALSLRDGIWKIVQFHNSAMPGS
ncbi:MAG: nuclear transport factor 2 family protein [Proteobacteria bacterium]|nr:nuclear transport factor 2 family protein [Pseudomonadota bacterium]